MKLEKRSSFSNNGDISNLCASLFPLASWFSILFDVFQTMNDLILWLLCAFCWVQAFAKQWKRMSQITARWHPNYFQNTVQEQNEANRSLVPVISYSVLETSSRNERIPYGYQIQGSVATKTLNRHRAIQRRSTKGKGETILFFASKSLERLKRLV